jgi:hypothetical protein
MNWSQYQEAVFADITTHDNVFVDAVAGSGKSTVIKEAVARIPASETVFVCAFNTHIRDPLADHFGGWPNVTVDTLNGFGNKIVRSNIRGFIKVDKDKTKNVLFFEVYQGKNTSDEDKKTYYRIRHGVAKVISLLKANMIWYPTDDDIIGLAMEYDVKVPDDMYVWLKIVKQTYQLGWEQEKRIDFDDQIAYPLFHNLIVPTFKYVFVDESQDLSPFQIELTARAGGVSDGKLREDDSTYVETDAKMVYVGDPRQAIYQFRGADKHAVQTIIRMLNCKSLPLSVCYRCSKAVVAAAQRIVPHIQAAPNAIEGSEETIERSDLRNRVKDGDFILCRTTAPLVSECLGLIAQGRKASVKGRDFADTLVEMLPDSGTVLEAIEALDTEYQPRISKYQAMGQDDKAIVLTDSLDCIKALALNCKTVQDIRNTIDAIFSKNISSGVTLSTGHKSKGLEAETVYVIRPDLIPHPKSHDIEAEMNLKYVMTTRAKVNIVWVNEPIKE